MEEHEVNPDYIKRVNDGYVLAKYMPELAAKLKQAAKDREDGFATGIEQFQKENEKDRHLLPVWINKDRLSSLSKDEDIDSDLDRNEPDSELE